MTSCMKGLYRFRDESLIWDNLACYACVLGDKARARKMLDKAIELGGDKVKLRAFSMSGLPQSVVAV